MPDTKKEKPLGILRRSEARMAAVKALYATVVSTNAEEKPDPWAVTLGVISSYDANDPDHHFEVRPDEKFLAKIISGVVENLEGIDAIILRNLGEGWTYDRMGHVMVALLRAAVFELSASQKLPFKVIINEYVDVARAFFESKEASFVNGILDKIAREVRD
jgi:transcription antitermination protein NusB